MTRRRESTANRADRLAHELEHALDTHHAARRADLDQLERGVPLADFECRHMQIGFCADCHTATETEAPYAL